MLLFVVDGYAFLTTDTGKMLLISSVVILMLELSTIMPKLSFFLLISTSLANIFLFRVAIETLEKRVKHMSKVNNKNTRTTSLMSFWCL